jgi:tetratricopeptide (TPR) repeat protein
MFQIIGLDMRDGNPQQAADLIKNSVMRTTIVDSLDECLALLSDGEAARRLSSLVSMVDPSPCLWSDAARNPDNWSDPEMLEQLCLDAGSNQASPSLLKLLSIKAMHRGIRRVNYWRAAQVANPDDFWINTNLAIAISEESRGKPSFQAGVAESIGYFRAALATRPNSAAAKSNLALRLSLFVQHEQAVTLMTEAAKSLPDHYRVYLNLGVVLDDAGQHQKAVESLKKSLKLKPQHATTLYRLGLAQMKMDRYAEAEETLEESIAVEPHHADVWFALGNTYLLRKQWDRAIECYDKARAIDDSLAMVHLNRSVALRELGEFEKSREAAERSLKLQVTPQGLRSLGTTLRQLGKIDESVAIIREALELEQLLRRQE